MLLTLLHFARFFDSELPVCTDTRYYVYFAGEVADGAVPHRDFFDNKTQLASLAGGLFLRVGESLGADGLDSVRAGYLGLAALAAALAYFAHRLLGGGCSARGWLGLLPVLGFVYLGSLPALGNLPKLIMVVSATGAALAAARRRWFLAGAVAAFAPMDWQIGVLACLGVGLAALLSEERGRALARSALGAALVIALFAAYFLANGALDEMLHHTVGSAFARGEGPFAAVEIIQRRLRSCCRADLWLVAPALVGLLVWPLRLRRHVPQEARAAGWTLTVVHYGVIAFSLRDFQGSGDTMLLLHTLAFFAGVTFAALCDVAERFGRPQRVAPVLVVALGLALRPVLSPPIDISTPDAAPGATRSDQEDFARRLAPLVDGRSTLVLGPSEVLFHGGYAAVSPLHLLERGVGLRLRAGRRHRGGAQAVDRRARARRAAHKVLLPSFHREYPTPPSSSRAPANTGSARTSGLPDLRAPSSNATSRHAGPSHAPSHLRLRQRVRAGLPHGSYRNGRGPATTTADAHRPERSPHRPRLQWTPPRRSRTSRSSASWCTIATASRPA